MTSTSPENPTVPLASYVCLRSARCNLAYWSLKGELSHHPHRVQLNSFHERAGFDPLRSEHFGNSCIKYTPDVYNDLPLFVNIRAISIAALAKTTPDAGQYRPGKRGTRLLSSNCARLSGLLPLTPAGLRKLPSRSGCQFIWDALSAKVYVCERPVR